MSEQRLFAQASFPELYERELVGPLFRPWAKILLRHARLSPGDRVLDVACGTGIVARLAKEALGDIGRVVGVDISPPMVEIARSIAPTIEWRVGKAESLPLEDDERFDVVFCQQGLQFFPDKAAAAREMRRALVPGGRVVLSTWTTDEGPQLRELRPIAEKHVGPIVDRRHSFGDPDAIEELLREAGFRDIRLQTESLRICMPSGSVFVGLNAMALVGMGVNWGDLSEDRRDELVASIARDSAGVVQANSDESGFCCHLAANIAIATA